ncbi:phosphohistidine phosphatase SixA [Natronocella acetinitrilica]|uniref:Phosphohistidine phosphatase SixA n=2 Tax=Natronocella acetinitrilica TaxID=414046 RepID=A0AAE3G5J0_9GAMM|nr:phosphohistidine phosphatase SixA [Natronocella acetinitrilica]
MLLGVLLALGLATAMGSDLRAVTPDDSEGAALVDRLRDGGLVLYFRHADTTDMACDSTYRIGERDGQRNISPHGEEQSRGIGATMADLGIPLADPILAGPVYRARDTAELAFGAERVEIVDGLLADDYAGGRLRWVLDEHRRLMNQQPLSGLNQVLVGHRTPAIMVLGPAVGGRIFPEGAALVLQPQDGTLPEILGILLFAPYAGDGFHRC